MMGQVICNKQEKNFSMNTIIIKIASGHILVAHKLFQRGERKDKKYPYYSKE